MPKKKEEKKEEPKEEQKQLSIDEAIKNLEEFKDFLLRRINTEFLLEEDTGVKAIRSIERAIGYIKWARSTLRRKARQNSNYNYRRPYKKYYGGKRTWRRRY